MYNDIRHIESALDIADRDTGLEVNTYSQISGSSREC